MKDLIATLAAERGTSPEALRKWRERGKVPFPDRLPLFTLAKSRGLQLTERDFEFEPKKKNGKKKRRAA